jgi:CBS domain-containing protein
VLAIRHHIVERSTLARLQAVKSLGIGAEQDLDALADAQDAFLDLIARQQLDDIVHGLPATNTVAVKTLPARDRQRLRRALEAVQHIDELTRDLLFKE